MAFVGADWRNIDSSNRWPFSYDFAQRMAPDDAIVSVTWQLDVAPSRSYPVVDVDPFAKLIATSHDRATATCWIDGPTALCRYRLSAFITTANGIEDDLWAHVSCDPAP